MEPSDDRICIANLSRSHGECRGESPSASTQATAALRDAGVPYAVAGGNAVAAWISTIDETAVRNTQDVDILIRRDDLPRVRAALEQAGFMYRHAAGMDLFWILQHFLRALLFT